MELVDEEERRKENKAEGTGENADHIYVEGMEKDKDTTAPMHSTLADRATETVREVTMVVRVKNENGTRIKNNKIRKGKGKGKGKGYGQGDNPHTYSFDATIPFGDGIN